MIVRLPRREWEEGLAATDPMEHVSAAKSPEWVSLTEPKDGVFPGDLPEGLAVPKVDRHRERTRLPTSEERVAVALGRAVDEEADEERRLFS